MSDNNFQNFDGFGRPYLSLVQNLGSYSKGGMMSYRAVRSEATVETGQ